MDNLDLCGALVFVVVVSKELVLEEGAGSGGTFLTRPAAGSCDKRLGLNILTHSTDDLHYVEDFDLHLDIVD